MKQNFKYPILGSLLAFLLATSCCWLPFVVAVLLGSAVGVTAFSEKIEPFSGLLMAIGAGLAAFVIGRFFYQNKNNTTASMILQSTITCPDCQHQKKETMPTDACQYFYECENCKKILKPLKGDCCVYCSYGTVPCPPIQENKSCCK
jgi:hypothetical protein